MPDGSIDHHRDRDPRTRVVIVQAMKSTLGDHWYRSLQAKLAPYAQVLTPTMPSPQEPDAAAWQATLSDEVGGVDASTILIGHSVGNAAALRFLTSLPAGWRLGGLINVAGFSDPQPGNDATIPFVRGIDHDLVRDSTHWRHAVISEDDPEVPGRLTSQLARRLDSTTHRVAEAGHFRGEDGYTSFPLLEGLILDQIVATDPASTR